MPEPSRRGRPLARHRDVYTEADGLFGRLADLVIENPVRSGGFVTMILMSGAIITNAAFFQTAHHPDPFFSTRPVTSASAPAPPAAGKPAVSTTNPAAAAPQANVEASAEAMPSESQNLPSAAPRQSVDSPPAPAKPKARPIASAPKGVPVARPAAPAASAPPVVAGLIADTQRALADSHFYDGPVDGQLGPQTRAAISSFEMKIGLIPTGQPTPRLLQQIRRGYPPVAEPVSTGSIGVVDPKLKRIQSALNDIGYGPIPEDGRDGAKTAAAIRHFETDNRLPPTGRASDALTAKLVLIGAMPSI